MLDMKNRFIVLIDFSSYSIYQLQLAQEWQRWMQADMLLVHQPAIMHPALTDQQTRSEITHLEKADALHKLRVFAGEHLESLDRVQYQLAEVSLLPTLQKLLAERYNNLLFVGIKGTGFLKKIFLGSTAVKLVDELNCTVVAVPKKPDTATVSTLYVAIYYKYPLNLPEFDKLLHQLGGKINSLKFISIVRDKKQHKAAVSYLKSLTEQYREQKETTYETYEGQDAFFELKQFINSQSDGLLVVQRGARTLTDRVFRKFLINELVYDACIPLIILPA